MDINNYVKEIARKHAEKTEEITKQQFENALVGAILSGDFQRCVTSLHYDLNKDGKLTAQQSQAMTYVPYREKARLECEIEKLQAENKILKEALAFYAEPNHSYVNGLTTYTKYKDDSDRHEDCGYSLVIIGKRARAALEKIKEMGND